MLNDIKQRADAIKKTRMDAELLVYNSKVKEYFNFNDQEELKNNAVKAAKELKTSRITNASGAALYIGAIGAFALTGGIAGIILPVGIAFGGAIIGGLEATLKTVHNFSTTAEKENKSQIEAQLKRLEFNIKNSAVNEELTVNDYFKAAKDSLKNIYEKSIEKYNKPLDIVKNYSKSVSEILGKRDAIRAKVMGVKTNSSKLDI